MRKKLLSIALAVFLAASNLPVSAVQAAELPQETTAESETTADVPSETASETNAAPTEPEEDVLEVEEKPVADESSESENLVELSEDNFPDATFRKYLSDKFDKDGDGKIDASQVTKIDNNWNVYNIDDRYCDIKDLTGIEKFKNLEYLYLSISPLTSLDISQNTMLTSLSIRSDTLTSLDISQNTALTDLNVDCDSLAALDISQNTALTDLNVDCDSLAALDISQNTKLIELYVSCDSLISLNVSDKSAMDVLVIDCNSLIDLKVRNNLALTYLEVQGCDSLTSLDVSTNPTLKKLYVNYPINLTVGSKNTALDYVCLNYGDCVMPEKADLSYLHGFSFSDTSGRYDSSKKTLVTNAKYSNIYGAYCYWGKDENGTNVLIELTATSRVTPTVTTTYSTHVQTYGWKKGTSENGAMSGTSGEAKRLEAIKLSVSGNDNLGIQYTTHCQSYGWLPWSANGELNGTEGEAKRLEAIKIQLTGDDADLYDVYYRVHAQSYGWLGWAKNGAPAGTAGLAKRLEGIQVVVLKKGEAAPGMNYAGVNAAATTHNDKSYIANSGTSPVVGGSNTSNANPTIGGTSTVNVAYKTHVQTYGWQGWKYNGAMSGTSGQAKRLEGINIKLTNQLYDGDIVYTTHVQTYGWQGSENDQSKWSKNGAMSGTSGQAKRLEAIKIALTGEMAQHYDIYYRVHAQSYGWLSWAKNGQAAGTAGLAKRLEGIQIVLVPKGSTAPASNYGGVTSVRSEAYISK